MPKAGPASEPADVRRAAAAEGAAAGKVPGEPIELAPTAGPAKLDKMPFFEMLAAMSARDWEDRMVYLYRQDKNIIKASEKDDKYIERFSHPFDEEYVKGKHGGGQFLAILKNVRVNGAERKYSFKIEGSPIIHDDEISIAKKNEAAGARSETALLVEQLQRVMDKLLESTKQNGGAEQEAITRAVGMLSEASRGAIQIQQDALKSQLASSTGHPMVDRFLEAAIAKLGNEPKSDSLDQFTKLLALMRELNKGNERPAGGLLGNLGEIKGVLDVLKEMGVKIGGGAETAVEGAMDWKAVLASTLPQALQVIGGYADRWMQQAAERNRILATDVELRRHQAGMPAQLPPQPAPQPPPAQTSATAQAGANSNQPQPSVLPPNFAAAPAGTPAPPSQPPGQVVQFPAQQPAPQQQAQEVQVDFDFVCLIIRRCFDEGDSGDAPAFMLKRIYGEAIEPFRPYLGDAAQLKVFAGISPVIAEIMSDAEFDTFLGEFVKEMNSKDDEPEPEAEKGGPAA
jgi:hypothetical protein